MKSIKKLLVILMTTLNLLNLFTATLTYADTKSNTNLSKSNLNKSNSTSEVKYEIFKKNKPSQIEGVEIKRVDEGRVHGYLYTPKEVTHDGLIVVFGGSGGEFYFDDGALLTHAGYRVMFLSFIKEIGLPETSKEVPLDLLDDLFKYCTNNNISYKPLTMMGVSMGTCFIQAAIPYYKEIDNIVLIAPSNIDIGGNGVTSNYSMWTYKGEKLKPSQYEGLPYKKFWERIKAVNIKLKEIIMNIC